MEYQLTEDPYIIGNLVPAIICAAEDPDSRFLSALLRHGGYGPGRLRNLGGSDDVDPRLDPNIDVPGSEDGHWLTTPLPTAVECGNKDNVRVLVKAGADPNGVSLDMLKDYASPWIRLPEGFRGFEDASEEAKNGMLEDNVQMEPIRREEWLKNVAMTASSGEIIRSEGTLVPW